MLKFLTLLFLHTLVYCGNWKPVKIPEIFPQVEQYPGGYPGKPGNEGGKPGYPHPHPHPPHHTYPGYTETTTRMTTTTRHSTCPPCKLMNQGCGGFVNDPNECIRTCCDELECILTRPNIPDIGGTCQCKCRTLGQICGAFINNCNGMKCCDGLTCQLTPSKPDVGGVCVEKECPKCQKVNEKCEMFSKTCTQNKCCKKDGLVCVKTSDATDKGGVCRKKNCNQKNRRKKPHKQCNKEGEPCLNFTQSGDCAARPCCDGLNCAGSFPSADKGGYCEKMQKGLRSNLTLFN